MSGSTGKRFSDFDQASDLNGLELVGVQGGQEVRIPGVKVAGGASGEAANQYTDQQVAVLVKRLEALEAILANGGGVPGGGSPISALAALLSSGEPLQFSDGTYVEFSNG